MKVQCLLAGALLLLASPALADPAATADAPAADTRPPLYSDLGTWSHSVTTNVRNAQKFFDQGLRLCYGFNHDEAIRAFKEAARLDPNCAMAWWGVAYAAGPNINLPMDDDHAKIANDAIAQAKALAKNASEPERAWINALSARYSTNPKVSRGSLDSAYARAMHALAEKYPDDVDAAALAAEAGLDLNPWNQWTIDGRANPGTYEIVASLEAILAKHPEHPGANHFYIHAVEASDHPERANAAAQRLETLVPGAGHLVHMPSHIYARTGRYEDAVQRNRVAAAVDEKYIAEEKPQGLYPLMYYTHNLQFIWFCAGMEGRSAESIAAARKCAGNLPAEMIGQMPMLELAPPYPILALVRFGRWNDVLAEPPLNPAWHYARAMDHYARGLAHAGLGDFPAAQAELDSVNALTRLVPADQPVSINLALPLMRLASQTLAGEIARKQKKTDDAVKQLRAATAVEDSLHYDEPPTWYFPVREALGQALLDAGKAKDAEAVFREDLRRHPENGWSLYGLGAALRAQGNAAEAEKVDARFRKAWANADVTLSASVY
jgi:tetratricopeptide (TPR) repeat protein